MSRITRDICQELGLARPRGVHPTAVTGSADQRPAPPPPPPEALKCLVLAGGSGFLGRLLATHFTQRGWDVVILSRAPVAAKRSRFPAHVAAGDRPGRIRFCAWDGQTLGDWAGTLEGAEAVVNLTGRSVNCRYNARNRRLMLDSRVDATRVIGEAIARSAHPPRAWLNFSTATIYRHTFGPGWNEDGEIGATPAAKDAFSIEVATAWERAFDAAVTPHTRKVALRSAMVFGLTTDANNVYRVLRRLVRFGLGGRMGSGRQYVSWIHQTDFCRALEFLLERVDIEGPVNLAAPNPLSNAEMMGMLRKILGLPFGLPAPAWLLELGAFFLRTETELIIKSRRVLPGRLHAAGFRFRFETIEDALRDLEARIAAPSA